MEVLGPPRSPRCSQSPSAQSNDLPTRPHARHKRPQVNYDDIEEDTRRPPPLKPSKDDHVTRDEKDDRHSQAGDEGEVAQDNDGDEMVDVEEDDEMAAMQAMMGFGNFGSTKGKKVAGNNVGSVRKEKKSEYRQYMNRQGGFNRPLSPSR